MNIDKMDLNRFANLAADRDKLSGLSQKLGELEEKKRTLEARATALRTLNRTDLAEQLLDGTHGSVDFGREIEQIDTEIETHRRAIELQNQRLRGLKSYRSKQICDELARDYYSEITRKKREAARAMLEAIELDEKFISDLERRDIDPSYIGRVFFPQVLSKGSLQAFVERVGDTRN